MFRVTRLLKCSPYAHFRLQIKSFVFHTTVLLSHNVLFYIKYTVYRNIFYFSWCLYPVMLVSSFVCNLFLVIGLNIPSLKVFYGQVTIVTVMRM